MRFETTLLILFGLTKVEGVKVDHKMTLQHKIKSPSVPELLELDAA